MSHQRIFCDCDHVDEDAEIIGLIELHDSVDEVALHFERSFAMRTSVRSARRAQRVALEKGSAVSLLVSFLVASCLFALPFPAHSVTVGVSITSIALYPEDHRRQMTAADYSRFLGAGVLFCRDDGNIPQKAAASWLIGDHRLVMMNAHNFRDHHGDVTRSIASCFFQIRGKNYDFEASSLELGVRPDATELHITDDWALVRLQHPVDTEVEPQPIPKAPNLPTGLETIKVTMVSPAGHGNLRTATSSIENCAIEAVDSPSEDAIRRVRHNCNDGFGGSGSGLFDEAGHLIAMQSASLDMNRRMPFDIELHYGSALLIEGKLLESIRHDVEEGR